RADGVVATQAHAQVDIFGTGDALLQHEDGLVDHRHQDAVDRKAGAVAHADSRLVDAADELAGGRAGVFGGLQTGNQLYQQHDRHRIEEVHADATFGTAADTGDPGDGDGRGVGRDDRIRPHYLIHLTDDRLLDVQI